MKADIKRLLPRAIRRFEQGRYLEAEADFQTIEAVDAYYPYSWLLLCRAAGLEALGRFDKALRCLRRYTSFHPRTHREAAEKLAASLLKSLGPDAGVQSSLNSGLYWLDTKDLKTREKAVFDAWEIGNKIEYATVREGVRTIMFRDFVRNDPFLAELKRDGVHCRTLFYVKGYDGFSHQHIKTNGNDREAWAHSVISRDLSAIEEVVSLFKGTLENGGHSRLGELLGYPKCCRDFFDDAWLKRSLWDPPFEAALRSPSRVFAPGSRDTMTVTGHPYCNWLLRYIGIRATSWLSCSFECPVTIARTDDWFKVGRSIDSRAVDSLLTILNQPMTWECFEGTATVTLKQARVIANSGFPPRKQTIRWLGS